MYMHRYVHVYPAHAYYPMLALMKAPYIAKSAWHYNTGLLVYFHVFSVNITLGKHVNVSPNGYDALKAISSFRQI